jgi:hypothetical protein
MAVVFQETFVGAISSITMLAPKPYLTSLLGLDLWLNISQVMSRRQSNLNTLTNQTAFEEGEPYTGREAAAPSFIKFK